MNFSRLSFIFFLAVNLSFAQDQKLQFELSVGPSLSVPKTSRLSRGNRINGEPTLKSSTNVGAFVLTGFNYRLDKKWSVNLGLGYHLDRSTITYTSGTFRSKGNRNLSYAQVPINFNYHFKNDRSYQLGIGGFAGLLLFAREKGTADVSYTNDNFNSPTDDPDFTRDESMEYDTDVSEKFNTVSFGAFFQLKKTLTFFNKTEGFLLVRINQYLNSIKGVDGDLSQYVNDEKEPTTINLGIGVRL